MRDYIDSGLTVQWSSKNYFLCWSKMGRLMKLHRKGLVCNFTNTSCVDWLDAITYKDIGTWIYLPRPIKLTFYFFFITHVLKEGSPSVQDSFILHPIVIKKKKRVLRLLLEWATWSSPASGQVNLQAVVHVNRAESLFLWSLLLLHAAPLLWW